MGSKTHQIDFNTALNMSIATVAAVFIGILLKLFALPCWFICGIIAVVAVVTEHFLTVCPLDLQEYVYSFCRKIKNKVKNNGTTK